MWINKMDEQVFFPDVEPEILDDKKQTDSVFFPSSTLEKSVFFFQDHFFQVSNYQQLRYCYYCGELIISGFGRQGLHCERCDIDVHEKCKNYLQKPCMKAMFGQHLFRNKRSARWSKCDKCKRSMVGLLVKRMQCSRCGIEVHEKCQEYVRTTCMKSISPKHLQKSLEDCIERGEHVGEINEQTQLAPRNKRLRSYSDTEFVLELEINEPFGVGSTYMVRKITGITLPSKIFCSSSVPVSPVTSPMYTRRHSVHEAPIRLQKQRGKMKPSLLHKMDKRMGRSLDWLHKLKSSSQELFKQPEKLEARPPEITKDSVWSNWYIKMGIAVIIILFIAIVVVASLDIMAHKS